jgi:hypothetical protein
LDFFLRPDPKHVQGMGRSTFINILLPTRARGCHFTKVQVRKSSKFVTLFLGTKWFTKMGRLVYLGRDDEDESDVAQAMADCLDPTGGDTVDSVGKMIVL